MGTSDVTAEFEAWLEANWSGDLTVREWWARLDEAGWAFPTWPVGMGGRAESARVASAVRDRIVRRGALGPPTGYAVSMLAPTLLRHGSSAQQQHLLPRIARGELTACQLFSEPGAGSDLAGLRTRATLDGSEWIVNGQKVWSSSAHEADVGMLLARTDPAAPKHDGISYLVLPMDQPGVDVRPLRQMNGLAEFNEVFLTDARVPADDVVGAVNGGWRVAQTTLASERSMTPTRAISPPAGRAGWLDRSVSEVPDALQAASAGTTRMYSRSGHAARRLALHAGRWRDPVGRERRMQLHVLSEASRALMARLRGAAPVAGGANIAKLAAADIARSARDVDLDILGAAALLTGPDAALGGEVELMALSAHMVSIGGGTDQIQKNILAERILGLPKEKRED